MEANRGRLKEDSFFISKFTRQGSIPRGAQSWKTFAAFAGCFLLLAVSCSAETASWYSVESCKREGTWRKYGGRMANGKIFDDTKLTCASWDYPFGTKLKITNTENGKSVIVEVTDRGPAKSLYRKGRTVDLSKEAFSVIASLNRGIINIRKRVHDKK